jgi:hypothetical protein
MRVEVNGAQKDYGYIISEFSGEVKYDTISSLGYEAPITFSSDTPSGFSLNYMNININEPVLEYVYLIVDMYLVEYTAIEYIWEKEKLYNNKNARVYYEENKVYDASSSVTFKLCLTMIDDEMTLSDEQIQQIISESTEVV